MKIFFPMVLCFLLVSCGPKGGEQFWWTPDRHRVIDGAWIYLPRSFGEDRSYPLIVFLQGGDGAAGPNPRLTKEAGPAKVAQENKMDLAHQYARDSFIIVNPHMTVGPRARRQWYHHAEELISMVKQLSMNYPVDGSRIYLTGLSKGGHGSFGLAKAGSQYFAATVPIAGRVNCKNNCDLLVDHPIWIVHREGDTRVEVDYALETVSFFEDSLKTNYVRTESVDLTPQQQVERRLLTILPGDSHNVWDAVYESEAFYRWLLQFNLGHRGR